MATRSFASDNTSGAHPKVVEAISRANVGHAKAYGDDPHTARAVGKIRALFGGEAEVFLVFNGTGANVLGLSALTKPHEAIYCADSAHVLTDECNAPERFIGCKLVPVPTPDGKLTPDLLRPVVKGEGSQHFAQPRVVAVTQATEWGTVYSRDELKALRRFCDEKGLYLHMDGARLANAAAAHHGDVRAASYGADVLTFGGTKNGALGCEAVVFLRPGLAGDVRFVRKQAMQLASKMRFLAAQFDALLTEDLWLDNARHANAMAALLAREAAKAPGVRIVHEVEANEVFATLPRATIARLQEHAWFEVWDASRDLVRWVCSWDTTEEDVRAFARVLRSEYTNRH